LSTSDDAEFVLLAQLLLLFPVVAVKPSLKAGTRWPYVSGSAATKAQSRSTTSPQMRLDLQLSGFAANALQNHMIGISEGVRCKKNPRRISPVCAGL